MLGLVIVLTAVCGLMLKKKQTPKNKIVVFSREKIRKTPTIKYNGQALEVVFNFQNLGLCFHYNNNLM